MYDPKYYQEVAIKAERTLRWSRDFMASMDLGEIFRIDEIALLWNDPAELDSFLQWAVAVGGFNNTFSVSQDTMTREDNIGSFDVRFEFLTIPGTDWRIEAMCPLSGDFPLHNRHLKLLGNGCVVHASFKLPTDELYFDSWEWLGEAGFVKLAEYQNSYGWFSYWDHFEALFYVKPRVNRRDAPKAEVQ